MKKIILFLVVILFTQDSYGQDVKPGCLKANIFFLADWSFSVSNNNLWSREPVFEFLDKFCLDSSGVKVSVVLFGSDFLFLNELTDNENLINKRLKTLDDYYVNFTDNTIITNIFEPLNTRIEKDYEDRKERVLNIIILVSDGVILNVAKCIELKEELQQKQHVVFATLSIPGVKEDAVSLISLADEGFYFGNDFENLVKMIKTFDLCL